MDLFEKLPTVRDFRLYGRFYNISDLEHDKELPLSIICYIYPDYLFKDYELDSNIKNLIKKHCILLREQANYEDNIEDLKIKKELQIRRLEERIHKYYKNKYRDCKCFHK